MDILTFELDNQRYAFPAEHIVQVVQMVAITPLPGAPTVVEGVVNVRGTVVPVFDLRARFQLPPSAIDPAQHLVIVTAGTRSAAVRVDAAEDFLTIADSDITRSGTLAESGVDSLATRHVAGVAATTDGTTIIYDLAAFLSLSEGETLDEALVTRSG